MGKKIAVLVRDRQVEALRMAIGITLMDDVIDVYVLDRMVEDNEQNVLNLETIDMMDMNLYTNYKDNKDMKCLSNAEIADRLLDYDHIIPY
ncbi:hypothetical protein BMS3Abin07_00354 [bacterium BMS3Abin07]|nr:hypothetical protein BMS3Abin07_00354 [bacterium BMS3Abin07]GBE32726.1 hypothetical protein BMS3Bbin05_01644 [bacterium BMS3Bbin05]